MINSKDNTLKSILQQGMLPLFYHEDAAISLEIIRALYRAGIRILEYTNRGEAALENFRLLKENLKNEMPSLSLGIGTIKTVEQANNFIDAGADFIVSPIVNPHVAEFTHSKDLLWIPGCMTPTEIHLAQENNAALIKIFPANILGPEFISSIKDLFNGQLFIPTGGVEMYKENISSWFKAGVCAVGMGSKLITKEVLENATYEKLYEDTLAALKLVNESRSQL